ncbi:hypothetical protein [Streptomyces sp. NPDC053069]
MRHISALFIAALLAALAIPAGTAAAADGHICDTHTISSLCWR